MPPEPIIPDDPEDGHEDNSGNDEDAPVSARHALEDVSRGTRERAMRATRLAALREARYPSTQAAANALAGIVSYDMTYAHETARREITLQNAVDYAAHYGVTAGYILFGDGAPIHVSGIIGPGDQVTWYPDGTRHDGIVMSPPYPRPDALAALRVLGSGLGATFRSGDVIFIDKDQLSKPIDRQTVTERECVVGTAGGSQLLCKVIVQMNGHVVLLRYSGSADTELRIVSAAPVLWIRRAQADD